MFKLFVAVVMVISLALYAGWGLVGGSGAPAQEEKGLVETNETIEQEFELSGGATLDFRNVDGDLSITTGKPGHIALSAIKRARGADWDEAKRNLGNTAVDIERKGDTIVITRRASSGGSWLSRSAPASGHVDYHLVVQEEVGVRVTGATGSIRIDGIKQGISIVGTRLNAGLTNIRGGISIKSEAGSIRVSGASGEMKFESKTAQVSVEKASGPSLTIATTAEVTVKDAEIGGDVLVKSTSGNVTLQRLHARNIDADVKDGTTKVSEATADGTFTIQGSDKKVSIARAQAGTLRVATTSGDLELQEVQGGLDLKTQGGKVNVRRVTPTWLRVVAGANPVLYAGQLPDGGEHSILTTSGAISVFIARESSIRLDASTESGAITVNDQIPLEASVRSATHVQGTANGGRATVTLATSSGDIEIEVGEPWWR
ncbi:MAG: DUF4097 family beta strand repeat protein [Chloroflexi bacterium]|nr:DUF4097 family beta strand repeat protein [Chloroflexota bacterium]